MSKSIYEEALKTIGELYLFEESVQIPYDPPLKEQYKEEFGILEKLVERDTYKSVKFKTEHTGFCPNCESSVDTTTWRDKITDEIEFVIPKNKFCGNCGQRILEDK